jgi:hypothetical protein
MSKEVVVKSDHFQILVGDRDKGPLVDTSGLWDSGTAIPSVSGARELIALPIARFGGNVRVEVDVLAGALEVQLPPWESLGRFELDVSSGEVALWGPEMPDMKAAARIEVPNGSYSGEAFSRDTDKLIDELATEGPDRYRLVLWPTAVRL